MTYKSSVSVHMCDVGLHKTKVIIKRKNSPKLLVLAD